MVPHCCWRILLSFWSVCVYLFFMADRQLLLCAGSQCCSRCRWWGTWCCWWGWGWPWPTSGGLTARPPFAASFAARAFSEKFSSSPGKEGEIVIQVHVTTSYLGSVFRIRIYRIHMFLDLPDTDLSIIKKKKENPWFLLLCDFFWTFYIWKMM